MATDGSSNLTLTLFAHLEKLDEQPRCFLMRLSQTS